MKIIHLNEVWVCKLANLPESGMGYQRVDFMLKDNRVISDVMVYNAEEAHTDKDFDLNDIIDVKIHE